MSPAPDSIVLPPRCAESFSDRADAAHSKDSRQAQITGRPVVFVGRDYVLDQILDEIGRRLERDGCEIVRGCSATPPAHAQYRRIDYGRLVSVIADWGDAEDMHRMLVSNPAKLYGFA
jgi:hypothetical protein